MCSPKALLRTALFISVVGAIAVEIAELLDVALRAGTDDWAAAQSDPRSWASRLEVARRDARGLLSELNEGRCPAQLARLDTFFVDSHQPNVSMALRSFAGQKLQHCVELSFGYDGGHNNAARMLYRPSARAINETSVVRIARNLQRALQKAQLDIYKEPTTAGAKALIDGMARRFLRVVGEMDEREHASGARALLDIGCGTCHALNTFMELGTIHSASV